MKISQRDYIHELLSKYPDVQGTSSIPFGKDAEPQDEQPAIEDVRRAQKLVGELLWISCKTRPDLCFTIWRLGQLVPKTPVSVLEAGHTVLKYLRHTKDYSMTYGPPTGTWGKGGERAIACDMKAVEIFADASFSPGTERSQSGAVLT